MKEYHFASTAIGENISYSTNDSNLKQPKNGITYLQVPNINASPQNNSSSMDIATNFISGQLQDCEKKQQEATNNNNSKKKKRKAPIKKDLLIVNKKLKLEIENLTNQLVTDREFMVKNYEIHFAQILEKRNENERLTAKLSACNDNLVSENARLERELHKAIWIVKELKDEKKETLKLVDKTIEKDKVLTAKLSACNNNLVSENARLERELHKAIWIVRELKDEKKETLKLVDKTIEKDKVLLNNITKSNARIAKETETEKWNSLQQRFELQKRLEKMEAENKKLKKELMKERLSVNELSSVIEDSKNADAGEGKGKIKALLKNVVNEKTRLSMELENARWTSKIQNIPRAKEVVVDREKGRNEEGTELDDNARLAKEFNSIRSISEQHNMKFESTLQKIRAKHNISERLAAAVESSFKMKGAMIWNAKDEVEMEIQRLKVESESLQNLGIATPKYEKHF